MIENKKERERLILVAVRLPNGVDTERSLDELSALADTAGAVEAGRLIQARDKAASGSYIGKGKIQELRELIQEKEADGILCDDELTPAQMRTLSDELETKVLDRTQVILDIFASRARTKEGAIQVEMAQLTYQLSRLSGRGVDLSRLGGGIGTRGPGETKLETDRRVINDRISQLNKEVKDVSRHREVNRENRNKSGIPVGAIVGYTNAGKSTLLNTLTGADILAEDQLFATLDPTTRTLKLPGDQEVLLTDTVGFIRKLPHDLIEAFKSTLEEVRYSDFILHVVDASSPQMEEQMYTVYETLQSLGVTEKPILTVFNKQDKEGASSTVRDFTADYTVKVSARTGQGIGELKETIETILRQQKVYIERVFDYRDAGRIAGIRKVGELLEESYREDGIFVRAYVPGQFAQEGN